MQSGSTEALNGRGGTNKVIQQLELLLHALRKKQPEDHRKVKMTVSDTWKLCAFEETGIFKNQELNRGEVGN